MTDKTSTISNKVKESNFFNKLKSIKHLEIILALVVVAIILLVYSFSLDKKNKEETTTTKNTYDLYAVENNLEEILSEIDGAGKVSVLIYFDGTTEIITATNVETTTTGDGTNKVVEETKTPVLVNNNGSSDPIIVKEVMPSIKGVIIVAEGANDIKVRLNLLNATTTALKIDAEKVEIFKMK
jgi:stage III sporulation protein AG